MPSMYYWFECKNGHRTIRASNASRCLKCNALAVRLKPATKEEQDQAVREALQKHNEIPK